MALQMDVGTSREQYLLNLRSFLQSSIEVIQKVKEEVGWTGSAASHQENMKSQRDTEVSRRETVNEYSEEPLLLSATVPSPSTALTLTIDAETQRNILKPFWTTGVCDVRGPPASAGELTANFTREERLAMYQYTLDHTHALPPLPELIRVEATNPAEGESKELTGLELKKALRDFKRRRQAYRTKVSTKDKSQTQVMKEIIQNMMGLLGMDEGDSGSSSQPPETSQGQSAVVEEEGECRPRSTPSHSSDPGYKRRDGIQQRDTELKPRVKIEREEGYEKFQQRDTELKTKVKRERGEGDEKSKHSKRCYYGNYPEAKDHKAKLRKRSRTECYTEDKLCKERKGGYEKSKNPKQYYLEKDYEVDSERYHSRKDVDREQYYDDKKSRRHRKEHTKERKREKRDQAEVNAYR